MLYTIGHSNHPFETLLNYLRQYGVDAVFDVRSNPYSRFCPQYRYAPLNDSLQKNGITYLFYGKMLGARTDDPGCLVDGRVDFTKLAATRVFRDGLKHLLADIRTYRGCLLCAERDPLACHRTVLICRHLRDCQIHIRHILADGSIEEHHDTEKRLMVMLQMEQLELFSDPSRRIERAYDILGRRLTGLRAKE